MITTTGGTTTPEDFSLKSAYLNMKAQKLYFPLPYSQYKYTFMLEDDSKIAEIKVNRLIQKWFDAAKNNISTDKKIKLAEKTNLFTDSMKSEGLESDKNIYHLHHLSNLMNHAINQYSEDELNVLTVWLKQNTVWHPVLEGMYPVFTRLYDQAICKNINMHPVGIALYNKVRTGSISHTFKTSILLSGGISSEKIKKIVEEAGKFEKADFSILGDNIPKILEKLAIKDLLNFHKVNRENRPNASYELACRLKKLEILLSDIVKLDENAETNIEFLLGEFSSKIDNIKIDSASDYDLEWKQIFTSLPVLYMDFIKTFSNLKSLNIFGYQNVDFSKLPFCNKLESIMLHMCTINDFDSKNLNNIKKITISCCIIDDLKIDNPCPTVEVVKFLGSGIKNLNYLQFFPNLREFLISDLPEMDTDKWEVFSHCPKLENLKLITCRDVKDFSFLKHLKNLRELDLGASAKQLTDKQLREILTFCPNLKIIGLIGCDQILDALVVELREKNITIKR